MKKALLTSLFLIAMLISLVGSAAAAPLASHTISLVSVDYGHKGPIFTFDVNGKFSKGELKGTVHVQNGEAYDLHCTQVDEDTVTCTTSKKVEGVNVSVTWGGSTFWTYVPNEHPYCYSVYDWDLNEPSSEWVNYGTYCQDDAAQNGDFIYWYNPGWEWTYYYEFLPESPNKDWCPYYQPGDAYYFPICDPYYFPQ